MAERSEPAADRPSRVDQADQATQRAGLSTSTPQVWEEVLADFAAEREQWLSATSLRNWIEEDPLLDWLEMYGRGAGLVPDDALPGYSEDLDFGRFIIEQGRRFELRIMELLGERAAELGHQITEIHRGAQDLYDSTSFVETINAMAVGERIIAQGWLLDPATRTFGAPDLIVRADVLEQLFPGTVPAHEIAIDAPLATTSGKPGHYRIVDIKFTTLELLADGRVSAKLKPQAAQLWLYNQMLGTVQGYTPPAAFLLGRTWMSGSGKTAQRGAGAFERLAPVFADHAFGRRGREVPLRQTVADGMAWRRRLAREGAGWSVLPSPTVPELYPNASYTQDAPWHVVKRQICSELGELTQLPGVNTTLRNAAVARGISSWRDSRASAAELGITGPAFATRCDAVLAANRIPLTSGEAEKVENVEKAELAADRTASPPPPHDPRAFVLPAQITKADPAWRTPAPLEFYVDFETVSTLADNFSALPKIGGQALIFQIGCGTYEPSHRDRGEIVSDAPSAEPAGGVTRAVSRVAASKAGELPGSTNFADPRRPTWSFAQWTTDTLSEEEELRIIGEWVAHMDAERERRGLTWKQVRIYHWSSAETSTLESAYSSARSRLAKRHADDPTRYPAADWPELPWYDLLVKLVRAEPITVAGAFGFGLKAIAKAMRAHGLIGTAWGDGPADGLGAMVGAWRADAQARQMGVGMTQLALMREIATYNEGDCRVMAEILGVVRIR